MLDGPPARATVDLRSPPFERSERPRPCTHFATMQLPSRPLRFLPRLQPNFVRMGSKLKVIGGDDGPHAMSFEAWYQSNPGRSAVITCERRMIAVDQLDCLVTTIRERLRATPGRMRTRMTWDHTGTLWPD